MILSGLLLQSGPHRRASSSSLSRKFPRFLIKISVARSRYRDFSRSESVFQLWSTAGSVRGPQTVSGARAGGRFRWGSLSHS